MKRDEMMGLIGWEDGVVLLCFCAAKRLGSCFLNLISYADRQASFPSCTVELPPA